MAAAQAAKHHLATMETRLHTSEEPDAAGDWRKTGLEISEEPAGSLVELRGLAYESGLSQEIL